MTYSLVAFDPDTGEHGVVVQSNWFSVGSVVAWGEPGVGVVASQANPRPQYGPHGLDLMRAEKSAAEALAELTAVDRLEHERQVGMIDAQGRVAVHTGAACFPFCGHEVGEHHAALANLMASGDVWGAMSSTYMESSGSLTERLLDALDAGEAAGGDLRGRQSAAILVVPARGEAWERVVEVRVEDHPEPLNELRRLVRMDGAYKNMADAHLLVGGGDMDGAAAKFVGAWELCPEVTELRYWAGFGLIQQGEEERGAALLREILSTHEGWSTMLAKLTPADTPALVRALALLDREGDGGGSVGSGR
jgi:uncharacterized Ntn-hydrolase superfamily protein